MTLDGFFSLALQTLTAPREVARLLAAIRLSDVALATAFALVVVLNGVVMGITLLVTPAEGALPFLLGSPFGYALLQGISLGAFVMAMTWMGRAFGGTAEARQILLLMIWLQALRLMMQGLMLLLLPLSLDLSGLVFFAATAAGVWILTHFLDEVHELGSALTGLLVLILGTLAMAVVLSILLALFGVTPQGLSGNV